MRKTKLTLSSRLSIAHSVSKIQDLLIIDDVWTTYLEEPGRIAASEKMQVIDLGYSLLSALHAVHEGLTELGAVLGPIPFGDVRKEIERILIDDEVDSKRRSRILIKFDKCAVRHKDWPSLLKSFRDGLDKDAAVVQAKVKSLKSGKVTEGDIGRGLCCSIGFAICGAGFALRSPRLIKIGSAIVDRCC